MATNAGIEDRQWTQEELRQHCISMGMPADRIGPNEWIPQSVKHVSNAPLTEREVQWAKLKIQEMAKRHPSEEAIVQLMEDEDWTREQAMAVVESIEFAIDDLLIEKKTDSDPTGI
jgi:hypothetical protein